MNLGKAVERMVCDDIASGLCAEQYLEYVAGPERPDFFGKGPPEGFFWDVTTLAAKLTYEIDSWCSRSTLVHL